MKKYPQFVGWKYELVADRSEGKKWTKVPYQIPNPRKKAAHNAPATWGAFHEALSAFQNPSNGWDGIGFVFSKDDPFIGFDADNSIDGQGEIKPWGRGLLERMNTSCERSPSGRGFKGIGRGSLPSKGTKKPFQDGAVEIYDRLRFFTLTGAHIPETPSRIKDCEKEIRALYAELNPPKDAPVSRSAPAPMSLSDNDLVDAMFRARNGGKIEALWRGDTSAHSSASEAVMALVSHIAWHVYRDCGPDEGRIDRLFRQSKMADVWGEKWDRLGAETIRKVLSDMPDPRNSGGRRSHAVFLPPRAPVSGNGHTVGTEMNNSARNGHTQNDAPHPASFKRTDAGNAELFASLYGHSLRFDHARRRWLIWEDHCWREDADGEVHRMAIAAIRYRLASSSTVDDEETRKAEAKWALSSEARAKLESVITIAQKLKPISDAGEGWDADPWLVGVENGVIDLRSGELRDGRQEDRITYKIPLDYDPNATAPRFLRFLEEVFGDAELIRYIQRMVGYSLTGDTREEILFICFGEGSNGKSKFMGAIREALGPYAYNTSFSTLEASSKDKHMQNVASLVGRRFVTASETTEGTRLNEGRVKSLTGRDPMTANFMHQNEFTFTPVAKFWLAVNHKPRITDDSHGFWRRVRLIPFLNQFTGVRVEKDLDARLKAEALGILAWAVRGAVQWQQEGENPPAVVKKATEDYQQESDELAAFIIERCRVEVNDKTPAGQLYKAYGDWAEAQGLSVRERLSSRTFGERMKTRFMKQKKGPGLFYFGIGLLSDLEPPDLLTLKEESKPCIDAGSCIDNQGIGSCKDSHGGGSGLSMHDYASMHREGEEENPEEGFEEVL